MGYIKRHGLVLISLLFAIIVALFWAVSLLTTELIFRSLTAGLNSIWHSEFDKVQ